MMVYSIIRRSTALMLLMCLVIAIVPSISTIAQDETASTITRPIVSQTFTQGDITVDLLFDNIEQGGIGIIHVHGADLQGVRMRFIDDVIEFFPIADEGYYGILTVYIEQTPRAYEASLVALLTNEQSQTFTFNVDVTQPIFIRETFELPQSLVYLISPEVERGELARLNAIFEGFTPTVLWDSEGFRMPIDTPTASPFGSFRLLNESVNTRHTGWDLRAGIGVPIMASASGVVAFAGLLDIRGNYVAIDHGYGIYSGYAHMSQVHVTRGQSVSAGQIIGVVGSTGRSSGAHLHWEMAIHQHWINSLDFINIWLPLPAESD